MKIVTTLVMTGAAIMFLGFVIGFALMLPGVIQESWTFLVNDVWGKQ